MQFKWFYTDHKKKAQRNIIRPWNTINFIQCVIMDQWNNVPSVLQFRFVFRGFKRIEEVFVNVKATPLWLRSFVTWTAWIILSCCSVTSAYVESDSVTERGVSFSSTSVIIKFSESRFCLCDTSKVGGGGGGGGGGLRKYHFTYERRGRLRRSKMCFIREKTGYSKHPIHQRFPWSHLQWWKITEQIAYNFTYQIFKHENMTFKREAFVIILIYFMYAFRAFMLNYTFGSIFMFGHLVGHLWKRNESHRLAIIGQL